MNRIVVISYTETGRQLNSRLVQHLAGAGDVAVSCHYKEEFESTGELLRREWPRTEAFIFVGAMGIAVRHIAPLLGDKVRDPAVRQYRQKEGIDEQVYYRVRRVVIRRNAGQRRLWEQSLWWCFRLRKRKV